ncbi:hypothetical protein [Cryptosporangium phraense]|uniref:Uncharacterized protein n=1 Tax=Cryptosporangium phraense TaxID=2593070 RepID=A0A545AEU1_9ACTN|nr:hypothetical protein [Cryptosporangium phraense]TQS39833.1 hypothetical protein FL583_38090 [Cryptosporangium phraense]
MPTAWSDDDALLRALGEALAEQTAVPESVTRAGRAVFTWRTVDAELSALRYDSADDRPPVLVRADGPPRRSLTFETSTLTMELDLEYDPDALRGQLVATADVEIPAYVVVERPDADGSTVDVDAVGYFAVEPFPLDRPFRLRCAGTVTPWIS